METESMVTELEQTLWKCPLCEYTGTDHATFNEIMTYATENADKVHLNEISRQVQAELLNINVHMSVVDVKNHFLFHACDQTIVLNQVLRDGVELLAVVKQKCLQVDDDGNSVMDIKNIAVYLEAVKGLMSLYRHLEQQTKRHKTARIE